MELFTELVALKRAMNGGALPPMTPVPEHAHRLIDPAYTIGLGALSEDAEKGLRCPVRGCGRYFHVLTTHIDRAHADIGGSGRVRELLSLGTGTPLISRAQRAAMSERSKRLGLGGADVLRRAHAAIPRRIRPAHRQGVIDSLNSVNYKNLADNCRAQLSHRLIDLQNRLGRSPSAEEARKLVGPGFVTQVQKVFGSWNNAKAQCGLDRYRNGKTRYSRDDVLDALKLWYERHGDLPGSRDARRPGRTPLLPDPEAVLRALSAESWPTAMRRAAAFLDIRSGRYTLPDATPGS